MTDYYTPEQIAIVAQAVELLSRARAVGLVLEIQQVSVPPLAMGHYVPHVSVRKSRELYTQEAACKNH